MACAPARAGSDAVRQFPIAQGVPLSKHCKMKQVLARSSVWHKSCRGGPPVWNARSMASEAVVVEEMETSEDSEKKTTRWQRWQAHETMVLIAAKKQQDLRGIESTEAVGIESKKTKNKWTEIEAICREKGLERSAQQCQARWIRVMSAFTQIRMWEESRKPEQPSFWSLKLDERKTLGFLPSLDQKTYNALDELYNSKADATENASVKDDGDSKNLSEDRSLAEEACSDKDEKGKGFFELCEDTTPLCPKTAEDISTAWTGNVESNCIEAQNKNDVSQTVEVMVPQLDVPIVCCDKNEKGQGFFEVCEDTSPLRPKNAEDISTAWTGNIESNCIEAQNKNDASQTVEGMVAQLNIPIVEAAYVTGALKQDPEDNNRSEIFESICCAQDEGSEKIELQPSEEGHVEMIVYTAEKNAPMLDCCTGPSFEEKKVGHLQDGSNEYNEQTTESSQNIEHFEVAVKDPDSYVKREPCEQSQSVNDRDRSDTIERLKVAIKEGEYLTEIRGSTLDANPPALTCIQHQFQHAGSASQQKSTFKGDGGSFESAHEAKRAGALEVEAKELEFIIKDDRGSPVTSGKGSIEDQSQKTITSSKADDDVFTYIPAATGNLVRSAVQTIRKFFNF